MTWITVNEAAKIWDVTTQAAAKCIHSRKMRTRRVDGGVQVRADDVEAERLRRIEKAQRVLERLAAKNA